MSQVSVHQQANDFLGGRLRVTHHLRRVVLLGVCTIHGILGQTAEIPEHYLGMHFHNADTKTQWPAVGIQSWRLWDANVTWPDLEPEQGHWSFKRLDTYLAMASLTKVEIVLPLGLSPRWAAARPNERSSYSPGNASEPARLDDWTHYVETVAHRYAGRISAYEIWNEPNEAGFFSGSTAEMVKLTCAAYHTIKAIDPAAIVVSPAATHKEKGVLWLDEFLALGGSACIDAVAFHFYTWAHEPPETLIPLVGQVREVMARRGVGQLPLWNTEAGWYIANAHAPVNTPWKVLNKDEATAFVARALLLGKSLGLARFHWYAWDDGNLGLLELEDASLKPAAIAYRTTAQWLQGVRAVKCGKLNALVMNCTLDMGTQVRRVVWSTGAQTMLTPPASWMVRLQRDLISNSSRPVNANGVQVGAAPILLLPEGQQ